MKMENEVKYIPKKRFCVNCRCIKDVIPKKDKLNEIILICESCGKNLRKRNLWKNYK
jgi:hypothetical protein